MKHEKKTTWRPNLFDLVIVALGAAVMAVIVLVMRPAAANISETVPMEYTVELQNMPEGAWELVNTGDMLYDNIRNQAMGTVVAVDYAPYTRPIANADATHVYQSPVPNAENVILTLRTNMTVTDSSLVSEGGYIVRVGGAVAGKGPCYAGTGFVIGIDRGEE